MHVVDVFWGWYNNAKKARVNSGLLHAVFLSPNPKFSQINALAWTSS